MIVNVFPLDPLSTQHEGRRQNIRYLWGVCIQSPSLDHQTNELIIELPVSAVHVQKTFVAAAAMPPFWT